MEKEFNRKNVREISDKVSEALKGIEKELGIEFDLTSCRFSPDKLIIKVEAGIKQNGKVVVSDSRHSQVNSTVKSYGLKFSGNFIGSLWKHRNRLLRVTGYETSRPKYPVSLVDANGRRTKAGVSFMCGLVQIEKPTFEQFKIWMTIDPDSDAVRESDVVIFDKVQDYIDMAYPVKEGDTFVELANKAYEKKLRVSELRKVYSALEESIESAIKTLKALL